MNWKNWLTGLIWAVLTGMGSGVTMVLADPAHFNFGEHWHDLLSCSLAFGLIAFFAYIKDSRPPSWPDTIPTVAEVKKTAGVAVILLAGALALSACSATQYHKAVVADTGLSQALFALDDAESAAFKAQLITPEKHKVYGAAITKLLKAGEDLTRALEAWDPSQPAPSNIGAALNEVQGLLADLKIDSPNASKAIMAAETVLSVLRGSGVLPAVAAVAAAYTGAAPSPDHASIVAVRRRESSARTPTKTGTRSQALILLQAVTRG